MAKDDYYVIVYQILAYLYQCLKNGHKPDVSLIEYGGHYCPINKLYWAYIMEHLQDQGFIEGLDFARDVNTGMTEIVGLEYIQITPDGIGYLLDNNLIAKARRVAKEVKDLAMLAK